MFNTITNKFQYIHTSNWVKMYALNATTRFFRLVLPSGTPIVFCLTLNNNNGLFYI